MVDVYAVLLVSTLNALHGLLQFYSTDFAQLNVDGLFGLRIIEGQLRHIYADYELGKHKHIPKEIMHDIKSLSVNASKIANTALPYVFDHDPTYFKKFKYLVHQPWTVYHNHRLTEPRLEWPNRLRRPNVITENETDECIGELLSSAASVAEDWAQDVKNQNPEQFGCKKVTKGCLQKMLNQKGLTGYELTHQVLYTNVAELVDCLPVIEDYLKEIGYENGATNFHIEYCSNLLHDLEQIVTKEKGLENLSSFNQDLVMEIQFTCGQLGFVEFTRRQWLEAILSWQDSTGCYKHDIETSTDYNHPTMRKLMREKLLQNSCSSHKSAVAAGVLSVYLRFLIDPGSGEMRYLRLDAQPSSNSNIVKQLPLTNFWKSPSFGVNSLKLAKANELEFELISPPPLLRTDRTIFAFFIIVILFSLLTYKVCRGRSMRSWKYKVLKY